MDEQPQFCPSCGMPNPASAAFCATCGRALIPAHPSAQAPTAGSGTERAALPPPPEPARPAPPPAPAPSTSAPPPGAAPPASTMPPTAHPPPPPAPAAYPPPTAPALLPFERPLSGGQKSGQFFGGLGLGIASFAAVVLLTLFANSVFFGLLGSSGTSITPYVAIVLFLALIGVMAYLLSQPRVRWLGYGLLAAVVALPVIAVVGCVVILAVSFRGA